ncbi:MAG: PQQ-binding-like beta-propeller repeat protein [Spirosomataceae bacterium]
MKRQLLVFAFYLLCFGVSAQSNWSAELKTVGTFSSPRAADLNKDGVKDIVLGAGRLEFQACDSAMIALDGKTGKMLWRNSARDQIFGSPALMDINNDQIEDVFITGRSSEFKVLNGKNGKTIWRFDTTFYSNNGKKRWFNFYNPQFIHDVDKDGLKDIIISNGGDIWVPPHDPNRATGRIVVLSSATGKLLAEAEMPDKKEIYMSIAVRFDKDSPEKSKIIFGTGGETVGGNLFVGDVGMIIKGDLSAAKQLTSSPDKGFIAPPAWVDLNEDNIEDIVVNAVDGRVMTFDGKTFESLWTTRIADTEAYSSMGIGYFNKDSTPDFFVSFAQGVWPELSWTKQAMLNGKTGKIEYLDSLGYYQTSSPVVADLTGDGIDEAILSVDYQMLDSLSRKTFYTTLYAIEFTNKESVAMVEGLAGHNVSSTPLLTDLDNDGFLDIIYAHGTNPLKTYTFDGMRVNCLKTTVPMPKKLHWGSYMGSFYDGVFRK